MPDRGFGHPTGYADDRAGDLDCIMAWATDGAPLLGAPDSDARYHVSGTLADDTTNNTLAKISEV